MTDLIDTTSALSPTQAEALAQIADLIARHFPEPAGARQTQGIARYGKPGVQTPQTRTSGPLMGKERPRLPGAYGTGV